MHYFQTNAHRYCSKLLPPKNGWFEVEHSQLCGSIGSVFFWVPRSTGLYLLRPPTSQYMGVSKMGYASMLSTWRFECENDDQRSTLGYYILLNSRLSLPKKYPVFRFIATILCGEANQDIEPGMRFVVGLSTVIPSPANINHTPINHALVGYGYGSIPYTYHF